MRLSFNPSQHIPSDIMIDILVPCFAVDLAWIDGDDDERSRNVRMSEFTDVNDQFNIRSVGTIAPIREEEWDAQEAMLSGP